MSNSPTIAFVDARIAWLIEPSCEPGFEHCTLNTWITRDGGDTWSPRALIDHPDGCPANIEAVSAQHAWITTSECRDYVRPHLLRTTDGGATWRRIDLGGIGEVSAISFFGPLVGRMIRAECQEPPGACTDAVWRTSDGGITWSSEPTGLSAYGAAVQFIAPERAWRLGQTGGGLFAVSRHQLFRFVGPGPDTPPVVPPETGVGPEPRAFPLVSLLALALGAVSLAIGLSTRRLGS
jgi:hypothetical protein